MKVYNNNQLYKSPAGDQLWNSGRQDWIFGLIGDQEGAISDPVKLLALKVGESKEWVRVDSGLYPCKQTKRKLKDKIWVLQRITAIFRSVGFVAFKSGSLLFKSNLVFLSLYNPETVAQSSF